jgi:hypothetical protein
MDRCIQHSPGSEQVLVNTTMNFHFLRLREFLDQLRKYKLIKREFMELI